MFAMPFEEIAPIVGRSQAATRHLASHARRRVRGACDSSTMHTEQNVAYKQSPPAGGPHDPVWQNCGYYDQPVRDETAVVASAWEFRTTKTPDLKFRALLTGGASEAELALV